MQRFIKQQQSGVKHEQLWSESSCCPDHFLVEFFFFDWQIYQHISVSIGFCIWSDVLSSPLPAAVRVSAQVSPLGLCLGLNSSPSWCCLHLCRSNLQRHAFAAKSQIRARVWSRSRKRCLWQSWWRWWFSHTAWFKKSPVSRAPHMWAVWGWWSGHQGSGGGGWT